MNIDHTVEDGRATAVLTGDLDIYAAAPLREQLIALCAQARELDLDLSETGLIDTAGLQLLLAARQALTAKGGRLRVIAVGEGCAHSLELLGFDRGLGEETG